MKKTRQTQRERRQMHIRKTVSGTAQKPRAYLFKSNKFLHVGVADDIAQKVIVGAKGAKTEKGAEELGKKIAAMLTKKKISEAVFDRSGYKYHGVVAKYAESLRNNGIKI